jgi:acetyltransferase-like isoleucine patch superfamily enzyme
LFAAIAEGVLSLRNVLYRPSMWLAEQAKLARCEVGAATRMLPSSRIENPRRQRSLIRIGAGCHVYGRLLIFASGGEITIGDHCFVGEDAQIWSAAKIEIGSRVFIAHGVNIHDTNSHPLSARLRHVQFARPDDPERTVALEAVRSAPVFIQDDVWIGFNAVILRGITIGKGAVVAAASVVTTDVAPFTIVAGHPARVVGQAEE